MYLPRLNEACGGLVDLTLVLFRKRRFRLEYAPLSDASWFETVIGHQCREFDTQLILNSCGTLTAEPL
jgi:hypothetical protein